MCVCGAGRVCTDTSICLCEALGGDGLYVLSVADDGYTHTKTHSPIEPRPCSHPHTHTQVEWRKKYRRYKPLTTPASCAGCHQKTVRAAYHHLCDACAQSRKVCAGCMESKHIVTSAANGEKELEAKRELLEREIKGLHLRKQQRILREFDRTAGGMDVKGAIEKAQHGEEDDDDDFFDDEEEEEEEEGGEGGEEEEEEEEDEGS